ncbi:MAG: hypothetical protein M9904_02480 [Chitinophagaceae bacterium]|nr:hypothetical protein [Chitinophagaceae bacterium]
MNSKPCPEKPMQAIKPVNQNVAKVKKILSPPEEAFLKMLAKAYVKSILS